MIQCLDVSFRYHANPGEYAPEQASVLSHINLTVEDGSFVAIAGHNGSGKSTLAKLFNGLLLPTSGKVLVDGLDTADESNRLGIRRRVGMVFQNPDNQMVTSVVEEDVAFGPENLGLSREEIRSRVNSALQTVGMSEYASREGNALSGGQKQRIAIAGMLAMKPDILVLDESTSMLDPEGRRDILSLVEQLRREQGITVIMITQYMDEIIPCDRVIVLEHGTVALDCTPAELFGGNKALSSFGLEFPESVQLRELLKASGLNLPSNPITFEELADSLCR